MRYGLVSNIQKYTIHDGPGIRTAVFFTGCTLRCLWCSNPETIEPRARLGVYPAKCLTRDKCGLCVRACPLAAPPIVHDADGRLAGVSMLPECADCLRCADACPPRAVKVWGEQYTAAELLRIISEDRAYYERTGGGVTLSGGEVMLQWEFARELLSMCREAGIHTCVETALNCDTAQVDAVCECCDLMIADIKHMDSERHRAITGAGNERILGNLRRVAELGIPLVIRTPVVPGYNADEANIRATGAFIRDELGGRIVQYQLLPYRRMGTEKYESLGIAYPMGDYQPPQRGEWEAELTHLADMLRRDYGLPAEAGSGRRLER